ncbi:Disease resistance protein (TIR-NBS-LRR class) family [Arabidopsis thaliana]|nr:Disease resistance protein (TIR-NBS-LRR class) family [Arabidopsis thaliana]NP_001330481.1 Disease resistance protein (TIR-NBS-LRR class) family [Arabidopsis thaliana]ANM68757.1 Disease resistance protein (TIR-NBS-LRR class) family [Arabidopsis thaliana]ANM68759.1 Disease resistance protein (TIR-NBS-LRR class) family [Arabidopsis thaliana]|eukprot:NP_001330479.1 Disease resistance protein (TIR-NBS-LRR class) family [Arabidopsis thaliana]
MISIVVFSKKYASSTWCLNELVEIHKCYKELTQIVIPIFYEVDPSDVRKQTREFGEFFKVTCVGKTEDVKQQWIEALEEVASIAGHDSKNWPNEANMIEHIAKDVLNKLIATSSSNCFGDLVGIEAHLKAVKSILCLESEEARMVGILGPSGIGKTTIARILYSKLSSQFDYHVFGSFKRTNQDNYGMKLSWEEQFLSEILDQKDLKISQLGVVKQRLKHKKVLIVLDDVDNLELLKTLVGQTGWFGPGSRIIVTTQDRILLKSHKIDHIYEVGYPSRKLALRILCRSAFDRNSPPDGFMQLANEVTELVGNLPLALNIMGSSLKGRDKEEWIEMMPSLRNSLVDGEILKTLRVSYDRLHGNYQEIFLYIACLLNCCGVEYIISMLGDNAIIGLKILAEKSLIHISPLDKTVEMHSLLQKLGRKIVRDESFGNPGKRRFLLDAEDICDVFTDNTGTETVLGISLNTLEINGTLSVDDKSFQGMHNLQFLKVFENWRRGSGEGILSLPQGLNSLPRKLRLLHWYKFPLRCMPSNFKAEYLVNLEMAYSQLERLWEGTQQLGSLKKMDLSKSENLKEIPDLSYAVNLEEMDLCSCKSLVTLPSSVRNLDKLRVLRMSSCSNVEVLPTDLNLESLDLLNLEDCSQLRSFPQISRNISILNLSGTAIDEESSLWIENMSRLTHLRWDFCPLKSLPSNFRQEHLVSLHMTHSKLEKLWEGAQPFGNLVNIDLSLSEKLKEFPNLSKVTNLDTLDLYGCKSLVTVPSSIQSLSKLTELNMRRCTGLEALPTDVNLESLHTLDLSGCSKLTTFPKISRNIERLLLDDTAIEEVPSWIDDFFELTTLSMKGCKRLRNISTSICELKCIEVANFSDCERLTEFDDASMVRRILRTIDDLIALYEEASFLHAIFVLCRKLVSICAMVFKYPQALSYFFNSPEADLIFANCSSLDRDAETLILESNHGCAVLPGGKVPNCFMNQACGSSVSIPLHESYYSEEFLGFKACIVLETPPDLNFKQSWIWVRCYFRDKCVEHSVQFSWDSNKMDHLLMINFRLPTKEIIGCPSQLDTDDLMFFFYHHMYYACNSYVNPSPCSVQRIKGCGIKFWDVSPRVLSQSELDTYFSWPVKGEGEAEGESEGESEDEQEEDEDEDAYLEIEDDSSLSSFVGGGEYW